MLHRSIPYNSSNYLLAVHGSVTCVDEMTVYVDGKIARTGGSLLENESCVMYLPDALNFTLSKDARVIAIDSLSNKGFTRFRASFSDGIITDTSWRCWNVSVRGWNLPGFVDKSWPFAEEIADGTDVDTHNGIQASAKWIGFDSGHIYCRRKRS